MHVSTRPYHAVPPEAADVLRPVLPGLADETVAAIAREEPDYAGAMYGEFGLALRMRAEVTVNRFVELVAAAESGAGRARETYFAPRRGACHAGRRLAARPAACWVGARLTWRGCVAAG